MKYIHEQLEKGGGVMEALLKGTNIPISNRNETKTFEFVPEFVLSKEIISIWSRRADSGPNRGNLFSIKKFGNDTKTFWFRSKNAIGTFVLSFLHYFRPFIRTMCTSGFRTDIYEDDVNRSSSSASDICFIVEPHSIWACRESIIDWLIESLIFLLWFPEFRRGAELTQQVVY